MEDGLGFGSSSNLPLVLMEDWSGNLVFAQPVIDPQQKAAERAARSTSKARSRGSRQSRGSAGGSTAAGDNTTLIVDAEAFETDDQYDNETSDGGDTTDSLPDEDMPSPPDVIPFSLAAAGLEANNAAFGVTTVDEAALARDLGLPLADARQLLERARAEEQQSIVGGVSNMTMDGTTPFAKDEEQLLTESHSVGTPSGMDADTGASMSQTRATTSPGEDTGSSGVNSAGSPGSAAFSTGAPTGGIPTMGSFAPDVANPERVAVIDGTGKSAPSPFMRQGMARTKAAKNRIKKRVFGQSPSASPAGHPRYSSLPLSNRFRGSSLHPTESFEREDTPSDVEMMVEPISLDDVLDINALHHYTQDMDHQNTPAHDGHEPPRNLRNLQRWERVPITTFRRSRHTGDATDSTPQSQQGPFRGAFSSPSMASTLAGATSGPHGYPHGMIVSPVIEAVNDQDYHTESPGRRRKIRKPASHKRSVARTRTSSLGPPPPLNLGR